MKLPGERSGDPAIREAKAAGLAAAVADSRRVDDLHAEVALDQGQHFPCALDRMGAPAPVLDQTDADHDRVRLERAPRLERLCELGDLIVKDEGHELERAADLAEGENENSPARGPANRDADRVQGHAVGTEDAGRLQSVCVDVALAELVGQPSAPDRGEQVPRLSLIVMVELAPPIYKARVPAHHTSSISWGLCSRPRLQGQYAAKFGSAFGIITKRMWLTLTIVKRFAEALTNLRTA